MLITTTKGLTNAIDYTFDFIEHCKAGTMTQDVFNQLFDDYKAVVIDDITIEFPDKSQAKWNEADNTFSVK